MKDLSQFITIALTLLFFGYMFYNYEPIEKETTPTVLNEEQNEPKALFGLLGMRDGTGNFLLTKNLDEIEISDNGELELIMNMIEAYNNMNATELTSFFQDSCDFNSLKGEQQYIKHEDFNTFFNTLDSVSWMPMAIVPLKIKADTSYANGWPSSGNSTGTIVHSYEQRFRKDSTTWENELIEVFYIKNDKIIRVNQFGKQINETW